MDVVAAELPQPHASNGSPPAPAPAASLRARTGGGLLLHALRAAVLAAALTGVVVLGIGHALGWTALIVRSGSMEPAVPVGSLVLARPVGAAEVRLADVVAVPRQIGGRRVLVLHRIVALSGGTGVRQARLKGDANPVPDPDPVLLDRPVARSVLVVPVAGYVVAGIRTTLTPSRLLLLVAGALALVLIWRPRSGRRDIQR